MRFGWRGDPREGRGVVHIPGNGELLGTASVPVKLQLPCARHPGDAEPYSSGLALFDVAPPRAADQAAGASRKRCTSAMASSGK